MSGAPARRLFFALWPDAAQRTALVQATYELVRPSGGRPVPAQNLHVTLAFLGAVAESRIAQLGPLARRVAANFNPQALPLSVTLAGTAHWAKPQVVVALAREDAAAARSSVASLAALVTEATAAAGFSPDLKPFRAHVTVARKVARAPRSSEMREVTWSFGAFALIESRAFPQGPVYSVVESYVLGSSEKVHT